MTIQRDVLRQALAYAARGWPVFPCRPGGKVPAIPAVHPDGDPLRITCRGECGRDGHGCHDATTDPDRIHAWWRVRPDRNVAIATGAPGPDVLDVDTRPAGSGWAAFNRARQAGLLTGAAALVLTRSGGLHLYFTGTGQRCGKLPRHFLDFKAADGYVIAPPSYVEADPNGDAGTYQLLEERDGTGRLDWQAVKRLLDPPRPVPARGFRQAGGGAGRFPGVIAHLSGLHDGDQRWRQLHWAACRAAELIAAGQLAEDEARAALMEASRVNGYITDHGEHEAVRKIDRGLVDGLSERAAR